MCEFDYFFRLSVVRNSVRNFVFNTSKNTEFCFYCYIELVSVVNDLLRKSDVFFEGR